MDEKLFGVITTIQQPTEASFHFTDRLRQIPAKLIVIGDLKGPAHYSVEGAQFWSLPAQLESESDLARKLPTGHYTRKNVGYLLAINQGAACIYETDDDNAPLDSFQPRRQMVDAHSVEESGWINVFREFTSQTIWPRGFPLDQISTSLRRRSEVCQERLTVRAPIQQGLANNSPDVDAIWRLILDQPFDFKPGPSISLPRDAWCPFNSQSTWWFPVAYPLMYLPSYCSFRMTDIWRSFVAQRCLWELDLGVVFHGPEVVQQRNPHDLMRDFEDEIPGYTRNREMAEVLTALDLKKGEGFVSENLLTCYKALVSRGFFSADEVTLVDAWLADLEKLK